jgi:hypothetical protein
MKTEPTPFQSEILSRLREAGGALTVENLRDLYEKSSLQEATLVSLERKGYVSVNGGMVKLVEPPAQTAQDQRCSPRLDAGEMAEMEHRSDVNMVHHFAKELRMIGSGTPPYDILNGSILRKLELAGLLIKNRRGGWTLSAECMEILHGR